MRPTIIILYCDVHSFFYPLPPRSPTLSFLPLHPFAPISSILHPSPTPYHRLPFHTISPISRHFFFVNTPCHFPSLLSLAFFIPALISVSFFPTPSHFNQFLYPLLFYLSPVSFSSVSVMQSLPLSFISPGANRQAVEMQQQEKAMSPLATTRKREM